MNGRCSGDINVHIENSKMEEMRKERDDGGKGLYEKVSHVIVFIFNWSRPLIIHEINLTIYESGPSMNHLIDGSP